MKVSGIYKIQSKKKPSHIYIGSALRMSKRWNEHLRRLRLNTHPNNKLQYHYNKYGKDDLCFSVLMGCCADDLIKVEQYFIDSYNPWFNICKSAGNSKGRITSEETKEKIREARKHQINTNKGQRWHLKHKRITIPWNKGTKGIMVPWNKGKSYHLKKQRDNSNYHGYEFTEEQRRAVSDRFRGRKLTSEEVEKIRQRMTGNKYASGSTRSEETKKRISDTMKKYCITNKTNSLMQGRKVINILTGEIFDTIGLAAKSINMKYRTLHSQLNGEHHNNTYFRLVA